jgi:hypothetical protein
VSSVAPAFGLYRVNGAGLYGGSTGNLLHVEWFAFGFHCNVPSQAVIEVRRELLLVCRVGAPAFGRLQENPPSKARLLRGSIAVVNCIEYVHLPAVECTGGVR